MRQHRKAANKTTAEVAAAAQCSVAKIEKCEYGRALLPWTSLQRLAPLLQFDLAEAAQLIAQYLPSAEKFDRYVDGAEAISAFRGPAPSC